EIVVHPVDQLQPAARFHLGQVRDQVPDGPGVSGTAGPQPERAAQFVVVPRQHPPAADAADGGRGQRGGGGLVHPSLGVGERQYAGAGQLPPQDRQRPLGGLVRRADLTPLDPLRIVAAGDRVGGGRRDRVRRGGI